MYYLRLKTPYYTSEQLFNDKQDALHKLKEVVERKDKVIEYSLIKQQ